MCECGDSCVFPRRSLPHRTSIAVLFSLVLLSCVTVNTFPQTCESVRGFFMRPMKPGQGWSVPLNMIAGDRSGRCPSLSSTCCSVDLEKEMPPVIVEEFRNAIGGVSENLRMSLRNTTLQVRATLLAKLGRQESVTLEGFRNSYHFMDQRIGDHIRVFFTRLQDFIEEKPDAKSIQDSVQEFFDAIFPLIFHNILAEKKPFESTYSTCLSMNRLKSNPFDKVPLEMTRSLTKTLQTSRTFTTALTDVERLLDDIKMIPFSASCQDALVRMALCPRCAGHDPAAPCPGFCLNVARGCLTSLMSLDPSWRSVVTQVNQLVDLSEGQLYNEQVIKDIDMSIFNAFMMAHQRGSSIASAMLTVCGSPRYLSDVPPAQPPINSPIRFARALSQTDLNQAIAGAVEELRRSKEFFAKLPDVLCIGKEYSGSALSSVDGCWTGEEKAQGGYQKTIATMGVEGLKLNPEVSFDPVLHSESGIPQNIRDWIQKLNLINESLSGILQSMAPPPRSLPTSSLPVPHRLAFADTIFPGAAASSLRTSGFQPVDRSSWNKDHWSQSQSPSSQNNQPRWETSRFESPKVEGSGDIWNDHFDPWRDAEDEWEGGDIYWGSSGQGPPSLWEEGSGAVDPWDTSSAAPPTTDFTIEEQPPDSQKTEKGGAEGGASITVRPMGVHLVYSIVVSAVIPFLWTLRLL